MFLKMAAIGVVLFQSINASAITPSNPNITNGNNALRKLKISASNAKIPKTERRINAFIFLLFVAQIINLRYVILLHLLLTKYSEQPVPQFPLTVSDKLPM